LAAEVSEHREPDASKQSNAARLRAKQGAAATGPAGAGASGDGEVTAARRRAEIEANLIALRERIWRACAGAERDPRDITVIAVTKTFPASDIRLLAALGIMNIGENRDQEAAQKAAACADLPLTWHFVGQLQTNKCRSVVRYADFVHSVDRPKLVAALSAAAVRAAREIGCLIQVDLSADAARPGPPAGVQRGGAAPSDVLDLAAAVVAADALRLDGVMAIAPLDMPAADAFHRLAEVAATVRAEHPDATVISAGMSGDLEDAIAHGATHVRVGTSLLGSRPPVR
jgi:pyridoxal phosphate enzyme (YggS family)